MGNLFDEIVEPKKGNLFDEVKPDTVKPAAPQAQRIPVNGAGPYTSGDEFQSLLQQAKQVGVENLPEPQRSQVKAAIQGGVVREADLMGQQASPAVQDTLAAVGEVAQGFVQSGDPEEVQKYAPGLLESLDKAFSKAMQMPGAHAAGPAMEEMFSTKLAMNGFNLMPDTIPTGNTLGEIGRASENLVKGAVRLLPEMLVSLAQNPHEFVKSLASVPLHEINLVSQALFGWKFEPGRPVEVTADQIRKARQEIMNNPLGVVMLGMMGLHGAKGKSQFKTVELKQFDALVEQAKAGEKLKKAEEKPPVTMGAEDVGKAVPEVKPEITPEAAAKAIPEGDVRYDALVDYGENLGKRHQFTLMVEGQESTFNVKDLAELPEKAAKKRTEMAEGAKWRAERDAKLAAEAKAAEEAKTPPVTKGGGDFTLGKLNRESYAYKGTGGIASEQQGKIKSAAFRDTETGEVFDTGPIHNLDNLPERAVASRDADGFVTGKSTLESGFVMNDGTFKTRSEVATKQPRPAPTPSSVKTPVAKEPWEMTKAESDAIEKGIHPKTLALLNETMSSNDAVFRAENLKRLLHPDNKLSRSIFEERTGVKLPKTVKGTIEAIGEWQLKNDPELFRKVRAEIATQYPDTLSRFDAR